MAATMDDCCGIAESVPAPSGETALTVFVTPLLASGFCHSLRDYQKHDLKQFHGEATLRFGMLIAIALVALTNAAMAQSKHPQDVQKINAALPTAKITPAQRAQVIKLRNEGEAFHNAGQHGKAEGVLEQAKAILRVR